ncbi:hypothetical protein KIM322_14170 [Lactobacillus xylocopicola]|uniref:Uncharacterized protein n=1 Tax=Lactobacillus xylocopicola TaxID=2976676 RepID=A0ABM8BIN9_9LACO|nr:hypothetical protein KIM322_14170 [Lactobacillus xylocopicola]
MLNGVDLASPYQTGFPNLGQDFVIIKFTEGHITLIPIEKRKNKN